MTWMTENLYRHNPKNSLYSYTANKLVLPDFFQQNKMKDYDGALFALVFSSMQSSHSGEN